MRSTRRSGVRYRFISKDRMIRLLCFSLFLPWAALMAEEVAPPVVIAPSEAAAHVGKMVTVKGKVEGQKTSKSGNTYLNFGGRFPNHTFSCLLRSKNFPEAIPPYEGQEVEVTGMVSLYEEKPQIELTATSQIRVVEQAAAGASGDKPSEPAP